MTLQEALESFVAECNRNQRLREMNRDWTRRIQLLCEDVDEPHWLFSEAGVLTCGAGVLESIDMQIRAPLKILTAIFSGAMTPTEPYNAGDLMVRGHQDDIMRLDIITLLIWGE